MDDAGQSAEDQAVDLRSALRDTIVAELGTMTRRELADAVGLDPAQVTRLLNGQSNNFTLDLVVKIENALGLVRGALLVAAGYVADVETPEAVLARDASIPKALRLLLAQSIANARDRQRG